MERIPIMARDLLDVWPRKIYFFPRSGKVMVKRLRKVNNDTIVLRERDYGARLFHGPIEGRPSYSNDAARTDSRSGAAGPPAATVIPDLQ